MAADGLDILDKDQLERAKLVQEIRHIRRNRMLSWFNAFAFLAAFATVVVQLIKAKSDNDDLRRRADLDAKQSESLRNDIVKLTDTRDQLINNNARLEAERKEAALNTQAMLASLIVTARNSVRAASEYRGVGALPTPRVAVPVRLVNRSADTVVAEIDRGRETVMVPTGEEAVLSGANVLDKFTITVSSTDGRKLASYSYPMASVFYGVNSLQVIKLVYAGEGIAKVANDTSPVVRLADVLYPSRTP